ncbi:hypothetical protein F5Y16DRAFT_386656 [Xylariaceae sp. FL0255]|nr:hypothetical protein F5Y16DRAFT_386656 [Xylariaceae sp. FL0255]
MLLVGVLRRASSGPIRCQVTTFKSTYTRPILRTNFIKRPSSLRFQTTSTGQTSSDAVSTPPLKSNIPQHAFASRICVYHAGTGRTTFLACLKLTTLFMFVFFGFVVTPAYYNKEGLTANVARTTLSAIAPVAFIAFTTSPFVAFIHMRIPPFARASPELLTRFLKKLPPQTELEITTLSLIAKPRVSNVKIADLFPANKRFGIVNLTRDTAADNARRKWYMFRAVGNFNVQADSKLDAGRARVPWAWGYVREAILAKKQV